MVNGITFYGSQVGGKDVESYSYTGPPAVLLRHDIWTALSLWYYLPFIVLPLKPWGSRELCELYPSLKNIWAIFLHVILIILQVPFLLSIPFWVLLPVPVTIAGVLVFVLVNKAICFLLNGTQMHFKSNPRYASPKKEHEGEQWVFMNGVAVGHHWLQSNIDRLALTFGRPVRGVHNKTSGIIFDVIQCLIQRNFNYATNDIREGYAVVKDILYQDSTTKVIFILHSQGGIEGGMIIDWLLQEVPQDLLLKLEVYTFGNAANHFNNPHLHKFAQKLSLNLPKKLSTIKPSITNEPSSSVPQLSNGHQGLPRSNPSGSSQTYTDNKTIRYIEHYAHTWDFVAQWGVLYFTTNFSLSANSPRYMGRVFEKDGKGHQLNQHYLDSMFPLKRAPKSQDSCHRGGIGNSGFEGANEDNTFMDMVIELGRDHDNKKDEREGLDTSYLGARELSISTVKEAVLLRDMSPISPTLRRDLDLGQGSSQDGSKKANGIIVKRDKQYRVRDLSRLWAYRNGRSPEEKDANGRIQRITTM